MMSNISPKFAVVRGSLQATPLQSNVWCMIWHRSCEPCHWLGKLCCDHRLATQSSGTFSKARSWHFLLSHMCASWLLSRKVGKMVWIFDEVSFEGNDVWFLGASYHVLLIASKLVLPISIELVTHTKQATFFRKRTCVLPGCYLLGHH